MQSTTHDNINEKNIIDAFERQVAGKMREKQQDLQSGMDDTAAGDVMDRIKKVEQDRSSLGAVKEGVSLGLSLRKKISETRMSGEVFYTVLALSVAKDFIDTIDMSGIISGTANIFLTVTLFIIFFLRRSFLKRYLLKRYVWVIVVEFIPLINAFPTYTVMTLLLKIKLDGKVKKLAGEAKELAKQMSVLRKKLKV